MIRVIRGTNDIVNDVKDLYLEEFEEARIEYNNKQTRNDRKIDKYNEQVNDLVKILPTFKIANATIHFDEISPHMHIVGVPTECQ